MAKGKRKSTRKSTKRSTAATSISHAARAALAAKGMKICHKKTPSAYNRKVAACMRGKKGSTSAFRTCAKQAAGKSAPRARSPSKKSKAAHNSTDYTRNAFSLW